MTKTFKDSNKALTGLNEKVSELLTDKGEVSLFLKITLINHVKSENTSHYNLHKDRNWDRVKDFSIQTNIPVTQHSSLSKLDDTEKNWGLKVILWKW